MLRTVLAASLAAASAQGPCGKEDCGANCPLPPFPTLANLPVITAHPDPFAWGNGTGRITHKADWNCRRAEINQWFQHYEMGTKPPKPSVVTGTVTNTAITVTAGDGTNSINFQASIQLPTTGTAPYPAMIGIGGISLNSNALRQQGIALINFNNNQIAQQNNAQSRGQGLFYNLYGADHSAGAMMAWAWGVSRILDVIEANPGVIDINHIGTTGCSRNGKGALVVGAFDERIALAIPQESGSGGTASWRVSDFMGTTVQTLGEIVGENVWFSSNLDEFATGHTTSLPIDHHELHGLMAPRGLLVIENTGQVWLGNLSCYDSSVSGQTIFTANGVKDHMGFSQIGGHNHCQFPASQQPRVDAFVKRFLLGQDSTNTTVWETDGDFEYDAATWQPWSVPNLQ